MSASSKRKLVDGDIRSYFGVKKLRGDGYVKPASTSWSPPFKSARLLFADSSRLVSAVERVADDVWCRIFCFLPFDNWGTVCMVSKLWGTVVENLWGSWSALEKVDTSRLTLSAFRALLTKSRLPHIRQLHSSIQQDYSSQSKFFWQHSVFSSQCSASEICTDCPIRKLVLRPKNAGLLFSDESIKKFCELGSDALEEIQIEHMVHLSTGGAHGIASCTRLKKLTLVCCAQIDDASLVLIAKACRELNCLCLAELPLLTNSGLEAVASHCKNLKVLALSQNRGDELSATSIAAFGRHCPELGKLFLEGSQMTDAYVRSCLIHFSRIRVLIIGRSPHLTDSLLQSIPIICPRLEALDISGNTSMTLNAVTAFVQACPKLFAVSPPSHIAGKDEWSRIKFQLEGRRYL
eukprot:GILK01008580.1.p1 GENE.GILK01008580.1~~GILK01008580.1.p1  ORF type:complete len:426 (+),score=36.81 GILK01008580.1:61-1278(+)